MPRPIIFLSDYGLQDEFVGVCHGVIERLSPGTRIIDLTHAVPRQDVVRGALVLSQSLEYMPKNGVFLAVVDPGVGTGRRPLAVATPSGQVLVGPDNGLLQPAWDSLGGIAEVVEITSREVILTRLSATFHGRDVFAPAAAMLAAGRHLEELGPAIDAGSVVTLLLAEPRIEAGTIGCQVLAVDRFGNAQLNIQLRHLREAHLDETTLRLEVRGSARPVVGAGTFGDLEEGQLGLVTDSSGWISVVLNGASAAEAMGLLAGDGVVLRRAER